LSVALFRHAREAWDADARDAAAKVGYGLALALPYFITWFYATATTTLSFAIVALMLLPTAVVAAHLFPRRIAAWRSLPIAYAMVLVCWHCPAIAESRSAQVGTDLRRISADDMARPFRQCVDQRSDGLQIYVNEHPDDVVRRRTGYRCCRFSDHDIRVTMRHQV
jgi:hypothetical protein